MQYLYKTGEETLADKANEWVFDRKVHSRLVQHRANTGGFISHLEATSRGTTVPLEKREKDIFPMEIRSHCSYPDTFYGYVRFEERSANSDWSVKSSGLVESYHGRELWLEATDPGRSSRRSMADRRDTAEEWPIWSSPVMWSSDK